MIPWKLVLFLLVLLLPGGSLVMLAWAAAKALHLNKSRSARPRVGAPRALAVAAGQARH